MIQRIEADQEAEGQGKGKAEAESYHVAVRVIESEWVEVLVEVRDCKGAAQLEWGVAS